MKKKLYIAEDHPAQAELFRVFFEQDNTFDISFFSDGLELYRKVMKEPPDMLILDIIMPSLSGLAISRLLKFHDDFSSIPIIIVSSITDEDIKERAINAGADDFLSKPFQLTKLREKLLSYLS